MEAALEALKCEGDGAPRLSFAQLQELVGFADYDERQARYRS